MTKHWRMTSFVAFALALSPAVSLAQDEPPAAPSSQPAASAEDEEEQAAQHFAAGRKLYGESKYKEAIEELLKAYDLRPAPPILLNIARTYEKLGDKKNALKFYKEFLLKSRLVDPNRPQVEAVVKELEKVVTGTTGSVTSAAGTDTPTASSTTPDEGTPRATGKQQLIHTPVDSARVHQPITVLAELPPGVTADRVTVYYRKYGELAFRQLAMEAQGEAFIVRIPGTQVTSSSLQYYLEATHGTGKGSVVAGAASKMTPNIIVIEGGRAAPVGPVVEEEIRSPYRNWMWVAGAGTVALLGVGVAGAVLAHDRASAMETVAGRDKKESFDIHGRDWESQGKSFATMAQVLVPVAILGAAGTGYLWWLDRQYVRKERGRRELGADGGAQRIHSAGGDSCQSCPRRGGPQRIHSAGGDSCQSCPRREGPRWAAAPWVGPGGAGLAGQLDF